VICNSDPVPLYAPAENLRPMLDGVIRSAGAGAPHPNEQPFLAMALFIAFKGLWPPLDGASEEGPA
jgi:microcystin-dependent protein